jgi:hypothetical protein
VIPNYGAWGGHLDLPYPRNDPSCKLISDMLKRPHGGGAAGRIRHADIRMMSLLYYYTDITYRWCNICLPFCFITNVIAADLWAQCYVSELNEGSVCILMFILRLIFSGFCGLLTLSMLRTKLLAQGHGLIRRTLRYGSISEDIFSCYLMIFLFCVFHQ